MVNHRKKAKCIRVIDGDTIDCDVDLDFCFYAKLRLRLARINAAELNSKDLAVRERAIKAKEYLTTWLLDKNIEIVSYKTEKYGRYLAEIYIDEQSDFAINFNDVLLTTGLVDKYE